MVKTYQPCDESEDKNSLAVSTEVTEKTKSLPEFTSGQDIDELPSFDKMVDIFSDYTFSNMDECISPSLQKVETNSNDLEPLDILTAFDESGSISMQFPDNSPIDSLETIRLRDEAVTISDDDNSSTGTTFDSRSNQDMPSLSSARLKSECSLVSIETATSTVIQTGNKSADQVSISQSPRFEITGTLYKDKSRIVGGSNLPLSQNLTVSQEQYGLALENLALRMKQSERSRSQLKQLYKDKSVIENLNEITKVSRKKVRAIIESDLRCLSMDVPEGETVATNPRSKHSLDMSAKSSLMFLQAKQGNWERSKDDQGLQTCTNKKATMVREVLPNITKPVTAKRKMHFLDMSMKSYKRYVQSVVQLH